MRGATSTEEMWQIMSVHQYPFLKIFDGQKNIDELIEKLGEVDEDLTDNYFKESGRDQDDPQIGAASFWTSLEPAK